MNTLCQIQCEGCRVILSENGECLSDICCFNIHNNGNLKLCKKCRFVTDFNGSCTNESCPYLYVSQYSDCKFCKSIVKNTKYCQNFYCPYSMIKQDVNFNMIPRNIFIYIILRINKNDRSCRL